MDGIPHPEMLRELESRAIHLGMSADALGDYYPVNSYDDFVRWFQGVKPLEGVLEAYQPLLALHIERLKAQNVVYTEIMIAGSEIPRDHGELVGRVRAFREWTDRQENGEIQVEYLAAFGRNRTPEQAEGIADRVLMLNEAGLIVGVVLAGPERGNPVKPLSQVFARFREAGLGIEIHAGEWCGPESVWDALEHGFPDRIGHGVTLFDDPALVRRFQEERIHVEMCLTSNVKTGSVRRLEEHPVRRARELGLNFAINTDDPGAFECSMTSECQLLADVFGFDEADFAQMQANALGARFQSKLRGPNKVASPRSPRAC
jgi:adenosine deaminase